MKEILKQIKLVPYHAVFFQVTIGGYPVDNPVSGGTAGATGGGTLGFWISRAYAFVLPITGMVAFLIFLWTGFQFLMSKGDPKATEGAKARFTYAVLGLIILVLAWSLLQLARSVLGLGSSTGAPGPGSGPGPGGAGGNF